MLRKEIPCTENKHYTVVFSDDGRFDRIIAYTPIYHTVGIADKTITRGDVAKLSNDCYEYPGMGDYYGVDNAELLRLYRELLKRYFADIKNNNRYAYEACMDLLRVKDKLIFDIIED